MVRIFGLDLGTTSIGWSVIEYGGSGAGKIEGLGVRIFPEARDPKGAPLNQQRRMARMMRRQTRRRRNRRKTINEMLSAAGLLPSFGSPEWSQAMSCDPYELRRDALARNLAPQELGRALYHLAKRRHFKARDLAEADAEGVATETESAEEKAERSGREAFISALRSSGQTLGSYLAAYPAKMRRRGHHAERKYVETEFDAIIDRQKQHHEALTAEWVAHLRDLVFHQRPVFWRKSTLGECRLIPGSELAAKGSWLSQQRRMLEKINNLAFIGGNGRPLDAEERAAILAVLQTQASMSWGAARRALTLIYKARGEAAPKDRFNLEDGKEPKLLGNPLEAKLSKIFGAEWVDHPQKQAIRDACEQLRRADYGEVGERIVIRSERERRAARATATQNLATKFGLEATQADEFEKLTFPTGWDAYSTEALNCLMPELVKGVRLGTLLNGPEGETWRNKHFPQRAQPTGTWVDRLPSPADKDEEVRIKGLRNPTVARVQNELRKVVNNLISVYGKPDLIRIELTREVGMSARDRDDLQKRQRRREGERTAARKDLESKGITEPSREDIEKWLLWKECGEVDPYSGDRICFDDLFRANAFDVEHIWPRARSNDDSIANKTLCRKDFNLRKGKRLPFEAFGADEELWNAMRTKIAEMAATKSGSGMSRSKIRKFLAREVPEDFASRQLNDTGYAARQAVASLIRLWPDEGPSAPVRVFAVTGRVTAHLRKLWGLNNILSDTGEKTRADHRHHAIDALVVACAEPGVTQKLSRYWQQRDSMGRGGPRPQLTPPWPEIRVQAQKAVESIVVSHRVRKKVSGSLHKQTIYGDTKTECLEKKIVYRRFTVRKSLESLSKGEIEDIRDDAVREIVRDWVAAHGGDPKKAFPPYPPQSEGGPEIRKARIFVKQQMALMVRVSDSGYADPGANHHMAIYARADGKTEFEVVSLYEAARRLKSKEPIIQRAHRDARFVMSLSAGEAIEFPYGERMGLWVVAGVWANGQVVLKRHTDAAEVTTTRPGAVALVKERARKVSVDPIGRVRPARD